MMKQALLLMAATLISVAEGLPALAQAPTRLTRPATSVRQPGEDQDMALAASAGRAVVTMYSGIGEGVAENKPGMRPAYEVLACKGTTGKVAGYAVAALLKDTSPEERARLKRREPAMLKAFATAVIALLDDIDAQSIITDEALGPGVYHDAVSGMAFGLEACHYFGHEGRL